MYDVYETLQAISPSFAPSGREAGVASVLSELCAPFADEIKIDTLGNLIVRKKGRGKKIMLSAHMDTHGLVVSHIEESGFLRFACVGALPVKGLLGLPVVFENGVHGVIQSEEKAEKDPKEQSLFIDIGAFSRDDAQAAVEIGDMAVFHGRVRKLTGTRVSGAYLDNRLGCVTLLLALEACQKPQNDLYFVFSAQDEVGRRGAKTAAHRLKPDIGLSVDVADTGDTPEKERKNEIKLGAGATIKIMDRSVVSSPAVVRWLELCARRNDIPYQFEVQTSTATDAGQISLSRAGVPSGGVCVPVRYSHSYSEVADTEDVRSAAALIAAVVCGDTDVV